MFRTKLILFFSVSFLCSCMTRVESPPPACLAKAIALTEAGRSAFESGDYGIAEKNYGAALELHRSFDNPAGILRNLHNLAVVQRSAGRRSEARESLAAIDRYLDTRRLASPSEALGPECTQLLAEARWLLVRLSMDDQNWDRAQDELSQALGESAFRNDARLLNLQARLFLQCGNFGSAKQAATKGWSNSRSAEDSADAARLHAKSAEGLGDSTTAIRWFTEALKFDQKLARSKSVTDDLLGLARACRQAGETSRAQAYASRALQAAQAAKDSQRAQEAKALLID